MRSFFGEGKGSQQELDMEHLSSIVEVLNERFGTDLTDVDKLLLDQFEESWVADGELSDQAQNNTIDNFRLVFDRKFLQTIVTRVDANDEIFKRILDDEDFRATLGDFYLRRSTSACGSRRPAERRGRDRRQNAVVHTYAALTDHDFELLMADLFGAEEGVHYEVFARGPDLGIDLRHEDEAGGRHVVQCKHYLHSTVATLRAAARDEATKLSRLTPAPASYRFVTSRRLTSPTSATSRPTSSLSSSARLTSLVATMSK